MSKKELAIKLYIQLYLNPASESYQGVTVIQNEEGKSSYRIDTDKLEECINTAGELLNTYDKIVGYGPHKVSEESKQ